MRTILPLALVSGLTAILSLTACEQKPQSSTENNASAKVDTTAASSSTTATAKPADAANAYSVFVLPSYPPYSFLDEKGNLDGFNPEIIKAIAERQGFAINLVPSQMSTLFDQLDKTDKGLIVSGLSRNPEREAKYALSSTYGYGQDTIMTRADNTSINKFEDLKGVKVAVQEGSASAEDIIKLQGENNPNTVLVKSSFLALKSLAKGEVDAITDDKGLLQYYAKSIPDTKFRYSSEGDYFTPYEMVIVGKKGDEAMINKINEGIKQIVADGTYAKIYQKWYGVAPTPEQIPH